MDKRTIYSKTGKGSLEISKKSIKLASDERQALILVDGKSNVGEIEEKLSRVSPVRLRAILDRLAELDLVREFVTKQGPDSIMPSLGGPTAMKVEELDELDFTALAPVASANTLKEVEERRQAAERAEQQANAAREEESRRQAAEAAQRQQQEAAERRQHEEAEARERARREEEAAIRARADQEARARADQEARARAEEEARRKAEEDARRRAEEESRRKAEEEAQRRAEEEARRKAAEEDARRKAAEEDARRKAAAEDARRKAAEEAERRQREEAQARERERLEAEARERERREEEARHAAAEEKRRLQAEEQERREREEAERRAAEESERRERKRREEEAKRAAIAEEKQRREAEEAAQREQEALRLREAEQQARERDEADRRERARREEEAKRVAITEEKRRREAEEAEQAARGSAADDDRRASEEAARYTAALTPAIEEVAASEPPSLDLDFNPKDAQTGGLESVDLKPLAGGGPDTFADTGMSANSIFESELTEDEKNKKGVEKEARRELEIEAKERAKADAKAKKDAEREAKRLAKASKVKVRRGGGSGFSMGKFIAVFIVLLIAGGVGYLYFMPIDKAAVESTATAAFGAPIKVGTAKFEPFPPQLQLTDVRIDDIVLPRVTAIPDPGSLASDHKIWKSIDVAGASINLAQVQKLVGLAFSETPRGVHLTVQRIRVTNLTITGAPVALPPMDANVLVAADGTVRQIGLSLPDGKAQLQLVQDEKGWLLDFESRGVSWPLGPKTAWESLRAKGVAKADGIRFESIALTHFGGNATGAGDVFWTGGWKFNGTFDVGGMDTTAITQAYYNAVPVSGSIDGKFKATMSAPGVAQLVESTQLEGGFVVNKPAVNNIDLARSGQAGAVTPGTTRFSDFAADLATSGARVQVKNIRANSGLLSVTGNVGVAPDKALSGVINIELGIASNRSKSALAVSGTPADPKLSK